jgi:cytoskeletal protein RodZ
MSESRKAQVEAHAASVEPSQRNWARTYVSVIVVEVLVLLALWWLQRHFGV